MLSRINGKRLFLLAYRLGSRDSQAEYIQSEETCTLARRISILCVGENDM